MKLIYEASNIIEAHLILNLLEQAELVARIDGEYLQGGIGELQAIGGIRVMVQESDFSQAQDIVRQWDAGSIQANSPEKTNNINKKPANPYGVVALVMAVNAVVFLAIGASGSDSTFLFIAAGFFCASIVLGIMS